MAKPSKTIRYKATSKHPWRTAYFMNQHGAEMLWHEYDCPELKDWELESEKGIVTLYLYYDNVVEGDEYEKIIQNTLEEFWTKRGTKFVQI